MSDGCDHLRIDPEIYEGGIAVWGALPAIYDSTKYAPESGIHVHARLKINGHKDIDETYKRVDVKIGSIFVTINEKDAVYYNISTIFGIKMNTIRCKSCDTPHLDDLFLATNPSQDRLCKICTSSLERYTGVLSNPLYEVKIALGDEKQDRPLRTLERTLEISKEKFRGGLQIWGSNPAILWTSSHKLEEEGIHVHTFDENGERRVDNTYGSVVLEGLLLDPRQVRIYMAQAQTPWLEGKITTLTCPICQKVHFDEGEHSYIPRTVRACTACGTFLSSATQERCVSNPIYKTLTEIIHAST